jgi:hypothetical protein
MGRAGDYLDLERYCTYGITVLRISCKLSPMATGVCCVVPVAPPVELVYNLGFLRGCKSWDFAASYMLNYHLLVGYATKEIRVSRESKVRKG